MSYSGSAGGGIGGVSPASTPLVAAVPGTKILLCKSGVKDKKPDPAGADYGELFVNYHSGSPMLCFKDNAGEIVEIKPTRQIDGGGGETPPSTGNEVGDTLWDGTHFRVWDGSTWVAVGPNDLAYVQKVDGGTITNSAGSDVDIPVVNNMQAGLMLPGDKNKLDTYPADAIDLGLDLQAVTDNGNTTTNGATFGGNVQSATYDVASSSGSGYQLSSNGAVTAQCSSGTAAVFRGYHGTSQNVTINADGSAEFAAGATTVAADGAVTVNKASYGTAFAIQQAGVTNAFIQSDGDSYFKRAVKVGSSYANPAAQILADGSGSFAKDVKAGERDPSNNTDARGVRIAVDTVNGGVYTQCRGDSANPGALMAFQALVGNDEKFVVKYDGSATFGSGNISLNANGSAQFAGDLKINEGTSEGVVKLDGKPASGGAGIHGSIQILGGGITNSPEVFSIFDASATRVSFKGDGSASFAGEVTADTFKYSGSAPSPALAGKEIDLVATLHLMAAKLAELGDVDVASLFVANDPAPVTQPADPADDADA